MSSPIDYHISPPPDDDALNALYAAAWPNHRERSFAPILSRSLLWVCAYAGGELVGFVYLAWDGGQHAFVLDTTVHPDHRRRGIGTEVVRHATAGARERGARWLHVDYEPHLDGFYRGCGFRHTLAGLIDLKA